MSKGVARSPLTRQRIIAEIDGVPLSGNLDEIEFIKKLWPIEKMNPVGFSRETTMEEYIIRHRINNFDMSNKDVLEALGIHQCSQKQFFRLLEAMLDPLCREIPEQSDLKTRLNRHLFHDGFVVDEVRRMSGAPVYAVRALTSPVRPRPMTRSRRRYWPSIRTKSTVDGRKP